MARHRSTNAELQAVDLAIVKAIRDEHPATLRGIFYRVVSAQAVPKTEKGYALVGRQLQKLRELGSVPYEWITDGTRSVDLPTMWDSPEDALAVWAWSYRRDPWADQGAEVQVYSEKDAITGVIDEVTDELGVALGIMRGYSSVTFVHDVAKSIRAALKGTDKIVYVYDLGDHDPSGVDAWRAFEQGILEFLATWFRPDHPHGVMVFLARRVKFVRIGVTCAQIAELDLPTRPTKGSDSRAAGWPGGGCPDCGAGSVEVDAIPPHLLREIVRDAVEQHIDRRKWRATEEAEEEDRERLQALTGAADEEDEDDS